MSKYINPFLTFNCGIDVITNTQKEARMHKVGANFIQSLFFIHYFLTDLAPFDYGVFYRGKGKLLVA